MTNRLRRKKACAAAIAALISASSLHSFAASIGVSFLGDGPQAGAASTDEWLLDPSESAGVLPQINWNNIATTDGGDNIDADQGTSGALRDNSGAITRVQLQYAGDDAWNTDGVVDTPDAKLMKGTLKRFDDQPLTLSFTNLAAGAYDVYVYGNVDGGPATAVVSIGNVTNYWSQPASFDSGTGFVEASSNDAAAPADGNYVKFTGVSPVNGAITIQALYKGGGNALGIAGLQLITSGSFPSFQGPTAIGATTQVQSVSVYQGAEASFTFAATNNANPNVVPTTYQWYKNGQIVQGATNSHFTFLAGPGDTNAQVYAIASVPPEFNQNNVSLQSATGTLTLKTPLTQNGLLKVETFPGATRSDVEIGNVPAAASISAINSFELPANTGVNNYTRRVSGYFVAPTTGDYVFFLSADDDADLFLSTDIDPAHKQLIAQETAWSGPRNWVSVPGGSSSSVTQKRSDSFSPDGGATTPFSSGIHLVEGQKYWIEAVQHQGIGGDNLAVTYKLTTEADPADGDAPRITSATIAALTSPSTTLNWVTQPSSVTTTSGNTITFTSLATSDSEFPLQYQWYRNGVAVPNATTATYSFPAGASDDNTQWYVVAKTADGRTITSGTVTLSVRASNNRQATITFSDQIGNDGEANPNPYTDAQGLPLGLTMTLTSFNNWNGDADHTPTSDNYLLYGNGDATDAPAITFNRPVQVPSIWVTTGPFGQAGVATLHGMLNGVEQWTYTIPEANKFFEVTDGAGKNIDSIQFSDYGDSEIDDITVLDPSIPLPIVTFSNQIGNDAPANPNPYTDAMGLPTGVTATFQSFNNWNGNPDHTATADNYLLYGNSDDPQPPAITFNKPVVVPSLWVSTGQFGQANKATITGYLQGAPRWIYTITNANTWLEVTNGVNRAIDSIRFSDYGDSYIDDMTVTPATYVPTMGVITFSDQVGNDVEANPNPYTDLQGLPMGVVATLQSFNNWNGNADHTPTSDNILMYGNSDAPDAPAIIFNQPVEVPSLWVSTGPFGTTGATLTGSLNGAPQWTYTINNHDTFQEVTAGAGKAIDRIDFSNYGDSFIDDVTVRTAPTAGSSKLTISQNSGTVTLSWTGAGTLEQTDSLTTPNWQTAPSQANPQTVTTTGTTMRFYRVRQ